MSASSIASVFPENEDKIWIRSGHIWKYVFLYFKGEAGFGVNPDEVRQRAGDQPEAGAGQSEVGEETQRLEIASAWHIFSTDTSITTGL